MDIERKTLVTSEDEIRVGDLLETLDCRRCGKTCRTVVVEVHKNQIHDVYRADGSTLSGVACRGYTVAPNCKGCTLRRALVFIIRERRLYRIDTGLLDEENPYTARKKSEVARQIAGVSKRIQQKARL